MRMNFELMVGQSPTHSIKVGVLRIESTNLAKTAGPAGPSLVNKDFLV